MRRLSRFPHLLAESWTEHRISSRLSLPARTDLALVTGHALLVASPTSNAELLASDALTQPAVTVQTKAVPLEITFLETLVVATDHLT